MEQHRSQPATTARRPPAGTATLVDPDLDRQDAPKEAPTQPSGHSDARFDVHTVGWGLVVGVLNAAVPLALWWLEPSTVHALAITLIAAVYIGFAVADGRPHVIAVECGVTASFVVLAAASVTLSPWLLVAGYFGHGCKDLWQHRSHFVRGTRWWPPFCLTIDWSVAGIIAVALAAGTSFH